MLGLFVTVNSNKNIFVFVWYILFHKWNDHYILKYLYGEEQITFSVKRHIFKIYVILFLLFYECLYNCKKEQKQHIS